jgi:hypothetical protein
MTARIKGGINIAMKSAAAPVDATVAFHRDVVRLKPFEAKAPAVGFELGPNRLWIDEAPMMSQAEVWLELFTDDFPGGRSFGQGGRRPLRRDRAARRQFPRGWIANPANIIHMVREPDAW